MSNRLFVGGLSWDTNEHGLRAAFEVFGDLDDVHLVTERETGRSRGFGFVTFADGRDAQDAIKDMDGQPLDGRNLTVNVARERDARGPSGGRSERRW